MSSSAVGGMATKTTTMVPKPSFKAGKKALKKMASQDEEEKPPPSRSVVGDIIAHGVLEKCSDGKRATTLGTLAGKWQARYIVMTAEGIWWFKEEKEFLDNPTMKARGVFSELEVCEFLYDASEMWLQVCHPERILSLRPVDKYADMKKWVKVVNKKKLGIQPEVEAMVIQKGGIAESGLWDEALKNEWGKVISDVGCSFHGTDASGHLNENDMIGYLEMGDKIQLFNWPDKQVEMDAYGYPNVKVKVSDKAREYGGMVGFVEMKTCSFDNAVTNAKLEKLVTKKEKEAAAAGKASGLEKRYGKKEKKEKKQKKSRKEVLTGK